MRIPRWFALHNPSLVLFFYFRQSSTQSASSSIDTNSIATIIINQRLVFEVNFYHFHSILSIYRFYLILLGSINFSEEGNWYNICFISFLITHHTALFRSCPGSQGQKQLILLKIYHWHSIVCSLFLGYLFTDQENKTTFSLEVWLKW